MPESNKTLIKPSVRGGFSDRMKIKPLNTEIQTDSLDQHSRVQLYNNLHDIADNVMVFLYHHDQEMRPSRFEFGFWHYIIEDVYNQPKKRTQSTAGDPEYNEAWNLIKDTIIDGDYDDALTVLEAVARYLVLRQRNIQLTSPNDRKINAYRLLNNVLEQEYVGYRFIKGRLAPITNGIEKTSIEEAGMSQYKAVNQHIDKALKLLSDRQKPDYENSIKESISAVESECEIITGLSGANATLGNTLKHLDDSGVTIHPALKSAFERLYGYASDKDGIRHGGKGADLIGGKGSTFEEAKYMLVSCSAFVNYLEGFRKD